MGVSKFSIAILLVVALLVGGSYGQSCPSQLVNLNVCAPFVVPGSTNLTPNSDCCGALQAVDHDCLCSTIQVATRLPTQCNIPVTCGILLWTGLSLLFTYENIYENACRLRSRGTLRSEESPLSTTPGKLRSEELQVNEIGRVTEYVDFTVAKLLLTLINKRLSPVGEDNDSPQPSSDNNLDHKRLKQVLPRRQKFPVSPVKMLAGREGNYSGSLFVAAFQVYATMSPIVNIVNIGSAATESHANITSAIIFVVASSTKKEDTKFKRFWIQSNPRKCSSGEDVQVVENGDVEMSKFKDGNHIVTTEFATESLLRILQRKDSYGFYNGSVPTDFSTEYIGYGINGLHPIITVTRLQIYIVKAQEESRRLATDKTKIRGRVQGMKYVEHCKIMLTSPRDCKPGHCLMFFLEICQLISIFLSLWCLLSSPKYNSGQHRGQKYGTQYMMENLKIKHTLKELRVETSTLWPQSLGHMGDQIELHGNCSNDGEDALELLQR
ncbi:hypothetical protein LXL04_011928 [Taraxacum kok-saghyz]